MNRKADDLQKYFTSILNHDLKTPVLAQMRSMDLLLEGAFGCLTPLQAEIIKLTKESCETILDMVAATLMNYKFEQKKIVFNYERVNILEIVEQCCLELDKDLKCKNLQLIIYPAETSEVVGDKLYLKTAIKNIIANSITYAYKNSVFFIKIKAAELNTCVSVINKGRQLSEEMCNCLFDYYACSSSKNTKIGFGIKLYLAFQIVKAHSGGIVVRNGTKDEIAFDIILPNKINKFSAAELNRNVKIRKSRLANNVKDFRMLHMRAK